MASKFTGFSPKVLRFFGDLEKNNQRDWFNARKEFFESEVRGPMLELVRLMSVEFARMAVDYVPQKPESIVYRIYRDTRFAKDKTPYKTHIGAYFQHHRVAKNRGAGFYFEVSHEGLAIGGGMYMPGPDELLAVRRTLAAKSEQFSTLCADRALVKALGQMEGERLARVPKGFDVQSPAADLLRHKQFYYWKVLDAKVACTPRIQAEVMNRFKPLLPVVAFLNDAVIRALEDQRDPHEQRPVRPEPMF